MILQDGLSQVCIFTTFLHDEQALLLYTWMPITIPAPLQIGKSTLNLPCQHNTWEDSVQITHNEVIDHIRKPCIKPAIGF
jgi:hypothetical protein